VRREAAEETEIQIAAGAEQARREAAEEVNRRLAASEEKARKDVAEASTPLQATAVELSGEQGPSKAVERVVLTEAAEPRRRESVEEAPRPVVAPAEQRPLDNPTEGLPLHRWLQAARQSDEGTAADDWPHDLLRRKPDSR
jgi:hypothetical protein